jgi:hypothetical protein
MKVMGTTTKQEVVKVDVNIRVKPTVFDLPADATFTKIPAMEAMKTTD